MKMRLKMLPLILVLPALVMPDTGDAGLIRRNTGISAGLGDVTIGIGSNKFQNWRKHRYKGGPGRRFVPPSVAAKRAQQVYGGKVLGVHLFEGIYLVKLRGQGRVWVVRVHAASGRVMGP